MNKFTYNIDSSTANVKVQVIVSMLGLQIVTPRLWRKVAEVFLRFAMTHIPDKQPVGVLEDPTEWVFFW